MNCVENSYTNGPCPQWAYNTSTNQLTTSGFTYDAAGNLTKDSSNVPAHTYQWDAEGRVSSVDSGSTWTFTYNALGQRVQWAYPGGADQHLFDPNGVWLGNAGQYSIVWRGNAPLAVYTSGSTQFNHINSLGSTTVRTNQAGAAVEDMLFYPWGQNTWRSWGSGGYNFAELPYYDTTTNTNLTTFRLYSPNLGRWLSPDLLGGVPANPQSLDRYAYVLNNPTSFVDPSGLCPAPPRADLVYTADCKHLHQRVCTTMDCADQYYGGESFYGNITVMEAICMKGGVLGYCGSGLLDSLSIAGNDIFDAIAQAPGMSFTPAGQLQINASGRSSTGTGSFSFDEGAWMQAEALVEYLGKNAPVTGYGTINVYTGLESATYATFADSLVATQGSNISGSLLGTLYIDGTLLPAFDWSGNVKIGSISGGVETIYVTVPSKFPGQPPTTSAWTLPAPP